MEETRLKLPPHSAILEGILGLQTFREILLTGSEVQKVSIAAGLTGELGRLGPGESLAAFRHLLGELVGPKRQSHRMPGALELITRVNWEKLGVAPEQLTREYLAAVKHLDEKSSVLEVASMHEVGIKLSTLLNYSDHARRRVINAWSKAPAAKASIDRLIRAFPSVSERVKRLRNQGFDNNEIALRLRQSPDYVKQVASKLVKAGEIKPQKRKTSPQTIALDAQVQTLRGQDLTNSQIAQRLGVSEATVKLSASRLIQAGKLEPLPKRSGHAVTGARDAQVLPLKRQGLSNREIAEKLGEPLGNIKASVHRLTKQGELPSARKLEMQQLALLDQQVLSLKGQGFKHPQIAQQLNRTIPEIESSAHRLIKAGRIKSTRPVQNQEGT